mmetsp:Transcript_29357/g.72619  ORF Transcript_29357/g.72619 Transcript_29357/m.72619 type:complete len:255 (+) Transcript_29357:435-1199(+)
MVSCSERRGRRSGLCLGLLCRPHHAGHGVYDVSHHGPRKQSGARAPRRRVASLPPLLHHSCWDVAHGHKRPRAGCRDSCVHRGGVRVGAAWTLSTGAERAAGPGVYAGHHVDAPVRGRNCGGVSNRGAHSRREGVIACRHGDGVGCQHGGPGGHVGGGEGGEHAHGGHCQLGGPAVLAGDGHRAQHVHSAAQGCGDPGPPGIERAADDDLWRPGHGLLRAGRARAAPVCVQAPHGGLHNGHVPRVHLGFRLRGD